MDRIAARKGIFAKGLRAAGFTRGDTGHPAAVPGRTTHSTQERGQKDLGKCQASPRWWGRAGGGAVLGEMGISTGALQ